MFKETNANITTGSSTNGDYKGKTCHISFFLGTGHRQLGVGKINNKLSNFLTKSNGETVQGKYKVSTINDHLIKLGKVEENIGF